ncbi:tetratricopeptide repeat protein [Streptomyces sp. NPDC000594]|uniref:ATP-binding protein n=1 Tax=Streptomyces sp. NPDC000594 TaxID=3154261 RepID=UPI00331BB0F4
MITSRDEREQGPGDSLADLSGSTRDVVQARSVTGGIHFHGGASGRDGHEPRPPRQLPGDISNFVNRTSELIQLEALLAPEPAGRPPSLCLIVGTPGAGKTSLALHWAHRVQDRFPDGQLYVNLRGYDPQEPVTPQQALRGFLTGLGVPPDAVPTDLEAAAALYRSLLADRRVLVVLDNAATASQVRPLLPGSPHCLVLVTSRGRLSGLTVRNGAQRITLGTLPEDEAVTLLRAVTAGYRPEDEPERLLELARLCARLPLALRIAAERAATHPHADLGELVADLRDESALWDALSTGDDEEAEAVRTVFAWSYRALAPDAARLFRLLGLFPGPGFGLGAASALIGLAERRTRQLLDVLVGAHLVDQTAPGRYEFHDLLRAYVTDLARVEETPEACSAATGRLLDWYLHTACAVRKVIAPDEAPVDTGPLAEGVTPPSFPDYDRAVDWSEQEQSNFLPVVRLAERSGFDRTAQLTAETLFYAHAPSAPAADWIVVAKLGLSAGRRLGDRAGEARLLHFLGFSHRQINQLREAFDCHEKALAIQRELRDRAGEAETLNALGLACARARRLHEAESWYDQAMELFRELDATPDELTVLSNRAGARYEAGRLEEARADLGIALPAHRDANRRLPLGDALYTSSMVHRELGDLTEGLRLATQAVELALEMRDHTLEGYWLLSLGAAQRALGEHGDALASYHRSATLHRRLGDRSREAFAWQGTGETYLLMGRPREASDFLDRATAAHSSLGDPWNQALALTSWAEALAAGEDTVGARERREQALRLVGEFGDNRAAGIRLRLEDRPPEA